MTPQLRSLPKPHRRALALAVLVLLLFAVFSIVIAPWLSRSFSHGQDMARLSAALESRQGMIDRIPALEVRLTTLKKDPQSGKRLLGGANASLASTALQASLRSILGGGAVQIVSVEGLPVDPALKKDKGPTRIAARITFRAHEAALRDVLQGVAAAVPFLYVQRLQVNATGGKPADLKSAASHLIVTLEVFGYWRPV
jgi:Type II secretion system (T2SS), protein M subtype b